MEKNNTHLAGEYFVAAELYRKGFSVGMTIGNAKAIDLFANKDNKTVAIQVKAIKNKKSSSWPIVKEKVQAGIIYIFVNLNDEASPDYFVATGKEAKANVKQYKNREVIHLTTLRSEQFIDRWDKIQNELSIP